MTITADSSAASTASPAKGVARSPGATYHDLLDNDTRPENVPAQLRWQSWQFITDADIPTDRYLSRDFHELEKERLWKRVWQMACREEDIPNPGDTLVYDICDQSILMVRTETGEIKGFFNACLHRGRQLREHDGPTNELRCPFHAYCWNLDGSLKQIPAQWDFPHVNRDEWALPEVQIGLWGGFVFINLDANCQPFEEFLGNFPWHFEKWPLEDRYKAAHVARIFPTNWKVVQEAFMEAFHVVATHPQLLAGIGDANSAYDWEGNFSRAITPNGTPSPHITWTPTEQEMFDAISDRRLDEPVFVELTEGMTARGVTGVGGRARMAAVIGADAADTLSDAELADSIYYTLFPNFHPWSAFNRIVYRFRPYEDRHDMSIMECMFLEPWDHSKPKPPAVPINWLGVDQDWTDATELGLLARVFNQDTFNLPKVQKGLPSLRKGVTLANYQETKIRHFHWLLEQWLQPAE
jgi:nitrite reductase/ring-hydroxylating ferredoxin subunit